MRVTLLLTSILLAAASAEAQEATAVPAPPKAAEQLPGALDTGTPVTEDPLNRIERRLDQIENRLQGANPGAATVEQGVVSQPAVTAAADENWRFRNYNGTWWYWMPSNRWVYWSNGAWVDFVPTTQPSTVVYRSVAPAYSYAPSYNYVSPYSFGYPSYYSSYGYYPRYGYGGGYYGGLGAVGLGLSIGYGLGHNHHHHGHYHGGHGHYGGHGHFHGGHGHGGHGHGGHHH
jgi:hypothetical protein